MAFFGSKDQTSAFVLFLGATAFIANSQAARAQSWSWFFRGPAAVAPAQLPPAATPVHVGKAWKQHRLRPILRETTADDRRRTMDIDREYAAIAERMSVEAALQLDPTLRRGDIAVTSTGLQLFRGPRAGFHHADEFQPLAQSSLARRRDLIAMQTVGRYPLPSAATKAAFLDVLTIRPQRKIVEVRARESNRHGFHVISVPPMR